MISIKKLQIKFKLDKKSIIFIGLVAVLLLELALILPLQVGKMRKLNAEIIMIRRKLANLERDWPKRSQYLEENGNLKEEIKMTKMRFFSPRQESSALAFISSESEKFNIKIELLKPAEIKGGASTKFGVFKRLPVTVKARGKFHNLVRFLEYLQNSKYFFEVTELDIFSGQPYNSIDMVICGLVKE
ncbi:MAG: hypothetical protein JSV34_01830 [Candidatus Omnitrophota bacterium]|nr:MAG: hypothetical protein JSV34_01830 [Candidatus Omnitrophota bacterium]